MVKDHLSMLHKNFKHLSLAVLEEKILMWIFLNSFKVQTQDFMGQGHFRR